VAQQDVEMTVPDLEEPKTRELLDVEEVIVNVAPLDYDTDDREEDPLLISGEASRVHVDSLDPFQPGNTTGITQAVEESVALKKAKDEEAEVELLLRADAALFYRAVQPVMAAITGAGIAKVNLVAYLPKDGGDVATADGGGE